jgi:hypothetical protein
MLIEFVSLILFSTELDIKYQSKFTTFVMAGSPFYLCPYLLINHKLSHNLLST